MRYIYHYITNIIIIDKNYRKQGVGKKMLQKFEDFVSKNNGNRLMVFADQKASDFYEKFGFEKVKSPEKLMDRMSKRAKEIYE